MPTATIGSPQTIALGAADALIVSCSAVDAVASVAGSTGFVGAPYELGRVVGETGRKFGPYGRSVSVIVSALAGSITAEVSQPSRVGDGADAMSTQQGSAAQGVVSRYGIASSPTRFNPHNLMLDGPLVQMALPSPYASTFTGLTNNEHAYGTPIHFPLGFGGYKYWMAAGPYPTQVKGTCTISNASPGIVTFASHPFVADMPILFTTTGALPTGITAGALYFVKGDANFTTGQFSICASPGGAAINTSSAGSGTHTCSIWAPKYENPTIYVSNDGENWISPPGIQSSPLFNLFSIVSGTDLGSNYADPQISYNPATGKLYLVWLWSGRTGATKSSFMVSESSNGLTWTTPVEILASTNVLFLPNCPCLIPTSTGWTMVALDTGTSPYTIITSRTTSSSPYTGWAAPSTQFGSWPEWSGSTATHPLGRNFWHTFAVGMLDGGIAMMAADNAAGGGAAYSLHSSDGGLNFSVQPFSAWNSAAAGGSWYRPGLCVVNDGAAQSLLMFISRIGPVQTANAAGSGGGFYMQQARVADSRGQDAVTRLMLRDSIHRSLAAPVALSAGGLLVWDSFNRADSALTLGNAESGQTWAYNSANVFGISTNRAYNTSAANSIATLDCGSQDYDVEVTLASIQAPVGGTTYWLVWGYTDASNFFRFGQSGTAWNFHKVSAGSITALWNMNITSAAGDVIRVSKRGTRSTMYLNDRPIDTYNDTFGATATKVGIQAAGLTTTFDNFIVRVG